MDAESDENMQCPLAFFRMKYSFIKKMTSYAKLYS
jgi:hypothetical protein